MFTAVDDQRRAFADPLLDVAFDLLPMHRRHQRPHLALRVHAVADLQRLRARRYFFDELVRDAANGNRN
jgi:hypothetical protein